MTDGRPPARREGEEPRRDPGAYIGNRPVRPTQTSPSSPGRVPAPGRRRTEPGPGVSQREKTAADASTTESANEPA